MQIMRLTDKHPTFQKFEKLCAFADELGISLYFDQHLTFLSDKDFPDKNFLLVDNEHNHNQYDSSVTNFPPELEYKIVYERDDEQAVSS